jgi:riboflavin transporter FmnP
MFIVMDVMDYMRFVPLFFYIYHIMICKKINKRIIRQTIWPFMYLLIIDGHVISIEWKVILSMI